MVLRNTTVVPSLGLHIGPACEAGLSAGMRRVCVSPQIRKKERKKERKKNVVNAAVRTTRLELLKKEQQQSAVLWPLYRATRVSWYHKVSPFLDF